VRFFISEPSWDDGWTSIAMFVLEINAFQGLIPRLATNA
jgi:hypothetical protein